MDSRPGIGDTYALGETIAFDVNYNEPVTVTGAPQLLLTIGSATRIVDLDHASDEGPRFRYVVQSDDRDADGISIGADALMLNGGTIRDGGGNDADLDLGEHAITNDADHKVDGSIDNPPVVESVCCFSEPTSGDTFSLGERIEIHVHFTEAVTVTGTPQVMLTLSDSERRAMDFDHTCCGSTVLIFYYEVQSSDRSPDGLSVSADALILSGGTIRDASGMDAVLDLGEHQYSAPDPNRKVDGSIDLPPVVRDVWIWTRPAAGRDTYGVGDTIGIGIPFSEPITVIGTPQLALTIGSSTRIVDLDDVDSGAPVIYFRYVVRADDYDADGISIAAGALSLPPGATITDDAGQAAVLDLSDHAIENDATRKVDGSTDYPPAVTRIRIFSRPGSDGTYARGETIMFEVNFSEFVTVTGSPRMALTIGNAVRTAKTQEFDGDRISGDQGLVFYYVVQEDDFDVDGISIAGALILPPGTTVTDDAGQTTVQDLAIENDARHKVDGSREDATAPSVRWVDMRSSPQTGDTYASGETIRIRVFFTEAIKVTGSPQLALTVGSAVRVAEFDELAGLDSLLFRYVVQESDRDDDGITVAGDALRLDGGTIRDAADNDAKLTMNAITNAAEHKVNGQTTDRTPPVVQSVAIVSDGVYAYADHVLVVVTFSEPVEVTGAPQLALDIGGATRTAGVSAEMPANSATLQFIYRVQAGDRDDDGIGIPANALRLNGGTIRDGAGNDAVLDTSEVPSAPGHVVDPGILIGCKQPGGSVARAGRLQVAARGSGSELPSYAVALDLELEENRDGSEQPVEVGCVALAAADRQFSYAITAGNDDARFAVGTADGMLSYVGRGEDAERTPAYELTIAATPQGQPEAAMPLQVRVAIVDVDDPGVVTLSTTRPLVGTTLTATLADQDDGVRDERWQWWRKSSGGEWTAIADATGGSYVPVAADGGRSLQARVSYADEHGAQQAASAPTEAVDLDANRRERMLRLSLTGFGRTVATTALNVIGQRFVPAEEPAEPNLEVTVNRRSLHVTDAGDAQARARLVRSLTEALGVHVTPGGTVSFHSPSGEALLANSAFSVERSHGMGRWGVWGSGDLSRFEGDLQGFEQEGTVLAGYLGTDYRFGANVLVGLAASYSNLDLTSASETDGDATLTSYLVNVYPYGFWTPVEWLGLWGLAGAGMGEAELQDAGGNRDGDLRMWLAATGQRVELVSGGALSLAAKTDGFITGVESGGGLPAVATNAWRVRVLLEGGAEWRPEDVRLAGSVELGGRLDGGDAEQGLGAEAGAELSFMHTGIGLGLSGRGRMLLVHEDRELRDWGVTATLRWEPPGIGSGTTVSVSPTWGEPASGVTELWRDRQVVLAGDGSGPSTDSGSGWLPDSVALKFSYGLEVPGGFGRIEPFAEIGFEDADSYHFGLEGSLEY